MSLYRYIQYGTDIKLFHNSSVLVILQVPKQFCDKKGISDCCLKVILAISKKKYMACNKGQSIQFFTSLQIFIIILWQMLLRGILQSKFKLAGLSLAQGEQGRLLWSIKSINKHHCRCKHCNTRLLTENCWLFNYFHFKHIVKSL